MQNFYLHFINVSTLEINKMQIFCKIFQLKEFEFE
jgi:hypothetical protein